MLFHSENNPGPAQIVWGQLHRYLVTRKNSDVMHPHLSGDMTEYNMATFQLDFEGCIRKILENLSLHLDVIFLRHKPI
jgi:hypothetical protein